MSNETEDEPHCRTRRVGLTDEQIAEIVVSNSTRSWKDADGTVICEVSVPNAVKSFRRLMLESSMYGYSSAICDAEDECRRMSIEVLKDLDSLPSEQKECVAKKLRVTGACIGRLLEARKRRYEHCKCK